MATASTMAGIVKKPGPPVPPRPQHATANSAAATLLRTAQRSMSVTTNNNATQTSFASTTTNRISGSIEQHNHMNSNHNQPPAVHKKPTVTRQTSGASTLSAGRTVIYKSPTINLQQRQEERAAAPTAAERLHVETMPQLRTTTTTTPTTTTITGATKPPLKLRKAPDVPANAKQQPSEQLESAQSRSEQKDMELAKISSSKTGGVTLVSLASNGVNLNRHNSMGCTSSPKSTVALKDTRLSLGRADTDKYGKIQLDQLQLSSQPLPKPRKIVQVPVATLDVEEQCATTTTTNSGMASIFRRSKTTLDSLASRGNVTTINTGNSSSPNRFLSGKTVEIKNNLKNAAERLFSEIIVSQNKHTTELPPTIITKHERAIQHQALKQQATTSSVTVAVNTTTANNNCTRININSTERAADQRDEFVLREKDTMQIESILNSPEKKIAFHEMLISELAAMRCKSSSMENLQTKEATFKGNTPKKCPPPPPANLTKELNGKISNIVIRKRCNSLDEDEEEDHDLHDNEDVDADNVEDAEDDEHDLRKTLKLGSNNSSRKRCPSGCSSDSSPYGTERSARIRTSDWIEVQDNGKQVTLTSCHISLEDSGLEDEERLDDISSSGVGDSWDSVKEAENERCRNIKR